MQLEVVDAIDALLESDNVNEGDEAGRQDKPYQQREVSKRHVYFESLWVKAVAQRGDGQSKTIATRCNRVSPSR